MGGVGKDGGQAYDGAVSAGSLGLQAVEGLAVLAVIPAVLAAGNSLVFTWLAVAVSCSCSVSKSGVVMSCTRTSHGMLSSSINGSFLKATSCIQLLPPLCVRHLQRFFENWDHARSTAVSISGTRLVKHVGIIDFD